MGLTVVLQMWMDLMAEIIGASILRRLPHGCGGFGRVAQYDYGSLDFSRFSTFAGRPVKYV